MKKFLKSKYAEWFAILILIGVPTFLMWSYHLGSAFGIAIFTYVVMGFIEDFNKKKIVSFAPLVAYILMVSFYAVKIVFAEEVFSGEEVENLMVVVKYGAILLLAIPILYINKGFNRSLD